MRITDNLYMLSGAPYGQVGNVYAIQNGGKIVLIDSGADAAALEIIKENLQYHALSAFPLTHLLLTHKHDDHMGNAWYFREKGAEVVCSAPDAEGVEQGGVSANDFGIDPFRTCKVDRTFTGGENLEINGIVFETMLVPGHTNGSAFFMFALDGKSMVATGDTVVPGESAFGGDIQGGFGWAGSYELDKEVYIQSLRKALCIEADVLLGGHGLPVMREGAKVIRRAFRRALVEFR